MYYLSLIDTLDIKELQLNRSGRTDAGVNAFKNYMTLKVKSRLTDDEVNRAHEPNAVTDFNFIAMVNHELHKNEVEAVRVTRFSYVEDEFDARYNAISRHYKYMVGDLGLIPNCKWNIDNINIILDKFKG